MKFGILGWGKIAQTQLAPAIIQAGHEIVSVGSRNPTSKFLDKESSIRWSTYEQVVQDTDVEAIYIALPNHLHVEWTLKALALGKHVLCEKPMSLTVKELEHIQTVSHAVGCYAYEAFMVRHHPQWLMLKKLDLGEIKLIQTRFSYDNRDPSNIRNQLNLGGGALWDVGCYAVLAGHWLFDGTPERVHLDQTRHSEWGTDVHSHGQMGWSNGGTLQFSVSTQSPRHQYLKVFGDKGWAELSAPFNPPEITKLIYQLNGSSEPEVVCVGPANHYMLMIKDFCNQIEVGAKTDLSSSLKICESIERLIMCVA